MTIPAKIAAPVEALVHGVQIDRREHRLPPGAPDDLVIARFGLPFDQDVADVEDHRFGADRGFGRHGGKLAVQHHEGNGNQVPFAARGPWYSTTAARSSGAVWVGRQAQALAARAKPDPSEKKVEAVTKITGVPGSR